MSPEFICLYGDATREEALERVARSRVHPDVVAWLYAMTLHRRLHGGVRLADVVRASEGTRLDDLIVSVQTVTPDTELEEVARLMTDFDLTVVPVVDDDHVLLGVVTVDDVLELVLPEGWRRRFNLFGGE
jgi:Mg/Co/Ni transporter MgtE